MAHFSQEHARASSALAIPAGARMTRRVAYPLDYRKLARRRLPPLLFEYIDGGSYAEQTLSISKARGFLDEVAGVGIYQDAFRVRPYGDRLADWLALDTGRVQDPSLRIGHNQIVGVIGVESSRVRTLSSGAAVRGLKKMARSADCGR